MAPSDDIRVGDQVNVPGGMYGTVRFLGSVDGKPGRFAGIELAPEHAARGKNNGEVDGRSYFNTSIPGAGIFVPINNSKYVTRRNVVTPPTPSRPSAATNFSKSVGPASVVRPRVRRPSLPRPESPRSAPSTKLNFGAMRSPSATVAKPLSASSLGPNGSNGFPRSPQKPSSRLSNRPSSRLSADDDDIPTLARSTIGRPSSGGRGSGSQEIQALQEKIKSLEQELQARDRQLDDQASVLAELQQSITELEGQDGASMRAQLREKNEKIAQLTAEFDSHRADFRSTLDTLEVAATETERVYEKRLDELMQQNRELQDRGEDVEAVAMQLKQLEELVSELEEGLEDARRGEAEARGEVEFLRGEVERAQLELKQEREKSAAALKDAEGRWNSRELEQKDDEIRGLKAIIHSLSRGDVNPAMLNTNGTSHGESGSHDTERISQLEERIKELEGVAEFRSSRIDELQRELGQSRSPLGRDSPGRNSPARNSIGWNSLGRNSMNGSRSRSGTVTIAPLRQMKASHSSRGSRSSNPVSHGHTLSDKTVVPQDWQETAGINEQGPMPVNAYRDFSHRRDDNDDLRDSDNQSSESGSLWCEICETNGHDILTCTTFGTNINGTDSMHLQHEHNDHELERPRHDVAEIPPKTESPVMAHQPEIKQEHAEATSPTVKNGRDVVAEGLKGIGGMSSSMGPVAGKASGVIDESKWCALCERDGHESIDCPFED
ncbi:Noc1p protein, putative [Talaromyces stipitatus ATCC 10500]|uniref:Noc1p protein, putative n=1 Tax=Talaromyces stipitatus (strain ATCC 10500 / CBS 375.48 / QM 6759 / NRRL 1006) TaxID=441959 RepID=B8MF41_TALSN|nr:Noc1p protein, putative [Talaromyces stipitatus ATCC 10500]EED16140.1 Noc1p protein, putative [Talaromyces stipitatus ATCC 10500]